MEDRPTTSRSKKRARKAPPPNAEPELVLSLRRLDPVLQFLTRATGKAVVPLKTLRGTLPGSQSQQDVILGHMVELSTRGVLHLKRDRSPGAFTEYLTHWDHPVHVGFPPPPSLDEGVPQQEVSRNVSLHGSTKSAAKRRLAALKRSLKLEPEVPCKVSRGTCAGRVGSPRPVYDTQDPQIDWLAPTFAHEDCASDICTDDSILEEEKMAMSSLHALLRFTSGGPKSQPLDEVDQDITRALPGQASYAGSNAGRSSVYGELSERAREKIAAVLFEAFNLETPSQRSDFQIPKTTRRKLYSHQVDAIDAAMNRMHTIVCTGTGSGKSMTFLLPVLAAATGGGRCDTSILMFPTKALAQDQMTKLTQILECQPELQRRIFPGVIDGDTPHAQRSEVAKRCNVILTNPDTLHAAILPGWKRIYRRLLERICYVVIDEAHMYEGVFGAHVALVLSRLMRLCMVCSAATPEGCGVASDIGLPTFLACSATMSHPEHHFRLLCPIRKDSPVKVVTSEDDGSPRGPKHFFIWNPPIMNSDGTNTRRVTLPRHHSPSKSERTLQKFVDSFDSGVNENELAADWPPSRHEPPPKTVGKLYRRHAADETALLLARAVSNSIRCIVFTKTRSLCEWIYERTTAALQANCETEHLVSQVESYRGGYTVETRRSIERRLFRNELLGVIGTSALELGVDIGGIDLSLHCGYPTSHSSLVQQAGRAGRGVSCLDKPSLAIVVAFNSPVEQHLWRYPKSLLSCGQSVPPSIPINPSILQGHILCAGDESPLTGKYPANVLGQGVGHHVMDNEHLSDFDLLGSERIYRELTEDLSSSGSLVEEPVLIPRAPHIPLVVLKTHPSVQKPWGQVSLRSIEAINYSIVDISHPLQRGSLDVVRNEAVLDTIPYSRVFYHAFPGAIIVHRGKRYEVQCMTRPPAFATSRSLGYQRSYNLGAFARPSKSQYSTRPLSSMIISVVKQMERIDSSRTLLSDKQSAVEVKATVGDRTVLDSLAGNGMVTVKREVHGYKRLSPVTRMEISRSEISLPPMEFDTFAFWIDSEASALSSQLPDYDAGVHALSHAILAVAPLFVPCSTSDIDCDHTHFECTRVLLFDVRAGGAGTCSQLWKYLFVPNGLLDAVVALLKCCPSCDADKRYDGGCPACLHCGRCLKFNQHLSRRAALLIAERMLARIRCIYQRNANASREKKQNPVAVSQRRHARTRAVRNATDLKEARHRQFVVGRPSWPLDEGASFASRQEHA